MRIEVNGRMREVRAPTLAALVDELADDPASVATALNAAFVPREARAATPLAEGDRVELLRPMQGG